MLTRRSVLVHVVGLGGTTALTGCLFGAFNNGGSLAITLTPISRSEIVPTATALEDLEPRARATVTDGLANETTVYERQPLEAGAFVLADGVYYRVTVEANGTERVERPVLEAESISESDGPVGGWEGLTPSDDFTLRCAIQAPDRVYEPPCVILGGDNSAFWPELQFEYFHPGNMGPYRLHTSEQMVTLDRYDYSFERVADNQSSYTDYVLNRRVAIDFSTVDLPAEQRDILETAAAEGVYRETSPPYSDALEDLQGRIQSPGSYTVYVRFDGTYYEASVDEVHGD
jgi:hypothetical protein